MVKLHRNAKISLAALFLVPIILSTIGLSIYGAMNKKLFLNSLYSQGEIVILNDNDFSDRYSLPGLGTTEDPFLIENYIFEDPNTVAIVIKDTTKHFVIRNCSIKKRGQPLFIFNIGFNTGTVINNTFFEDMTLDKDVKFEEYQEDYFFFNSDYQPYDDGFTNIFNAPGIRIENNLFQSNANGTSNYGSCLFVRSSDYSVINNNTISSFRWGIWISDSLYMNVVNNFCNNNILGLRIERIKESLVMNNICSNNTIGMEAIRSEKVLFISNNLSYNIEVGLDVSKYITSCQIIGNLFERNGWGLYGEFLLCNITYNYFSLNDYYSISFNYRYCYLNNIHHNAFINNNYEGLMLDEKQAWDAHNESGGENYWYNSYTMEGNFWSDLIWNEDSVYILDGGNATDQYPLFEPPIMEPWEDLY